MQTATQKKRQQIITFQGLNCGEGTVDGEFFETENLSTAKFPCLSQRTERKLLETHDDGKAIFGDDAGKLMVIDGTTVFYDGEIVGTIEDRDRYEPGKEPEPRAFINIGDKIIVFPDNMCFWHGSPLGAIRWQELFKLHFQDTNKADPTAKKIIEFKKNKIIMHFPMKESRFGYGYGEDRIVKKGTFVADRDMEIDIRRGMYVGWLLGDLQNYKEEENYYYDDGDGNLVVNKNWHMRAGKVSELKKGDQTCYLCKNVRSSSMYSPCAQYLVVDAVRQLSYQSYEVSYTMHQAFWYTFDKWDAYVKVGDEVTISGCGNDSTRTVTELDGASMTLSGDDFTYQGLQNEEVAIEWKHPNLSIVCQSDNRVWGAEGNTIYASALGDPSHFFEYKGVSTDSYAAAVGSGGEFTACCAYAGNVLFWKEHTLHKILGSYPAQYEIYTYNIPGVKAGCGGSLVNINEALYYQGTKGVYVYTGGTPDLITGKFGKWSFDAGRAGTDGSRYYISMRDADGIWGMYTYDLQRGLWLREDGTHAINFARKGEDLLFMPDNGEVLSINQRNAGEKAIPWSATLCRMDETSHGRKGYSKLYLRADLSAGSWLKLEISTDGGKFRQVYLTHNMRARTMVVPILPQRCDFFQIRLSGKGECVVRSLVREYSLGSEY